MLHEVCIIGHDGTPVGQVDAAIGTLCRNLSGPEIWKKTQSWGNLDAWEELGAGGGVPEPVIVTGPITPAIADSGTKYVNESSETPYTFTLPANAPAGTEYELFGILPVGVPDSNYIMQVQPGSWSQDVSSVPNAATQPLSYVKLIKLFSVGQDYWLAVNANYQLVIPV